MTCLQVQMLLHYYAIAEPYAIHDLIHANSVAVTKQRRDLIKYEMLAEESAQDSGYILTDRGKAFVYHILNLELPICDWRVSSTKAETRA